MLTPNGVDTPNHSTHIPKKRLNYPQLMGWDKRGYLKIFESSKMPWFCGWMKIVIQLWTLRKPRVFVIGTSNFRDLYIKYLALLCSIFVLIKVKLRVLLKFWWCSLFLGHPVFTRSKCPCYVVKEKKLAFDLKYFNNEFVFVILSFPEQRWPERQPDLYLWTLRDTRGRWLPLLQVRSQSVLPLPQSPRQVLSAANPAGSCRQPTGPGLISSYIFCLVDIKVI